MKQPDISFIVPILNEEAYLEATLESLARQVLDGISAEVLILDGGSSDGSRAIAGGFSRREGSGVRFRLLNNPRRRTPAAFNIGIEESTGAVVGFGGAHTIYPPRYFAAAVQLVKAGVADVVGGGHDSHVPSVDSVLGRAMACLYLSPMGSGVAAYHRRTQPGFVDTVYGGFYRREVLDRVGGFNEALTRNQDNELNARVLANGMRIYFDPALSTKYVLKADLKTFLKRGYLFGRYHPETWRNTPAAFRLRHAIPGLFVAYMLATGIASLIDFRWVFLAPLALYLALLIAAAIRLAPVHSVSAAILAIPLFVSYHFSYGAGTLVGLFKEAFGAFRPRAKPASV